MADDLRDMDEVLAELDKLAIRTTQGSFVRREDVEELIKRRKEATAVESATAPKPKNIHQARAQAAEFLKEQGIGTSVREPGRSVSARPSSRT